MIKCIACVSKNMGLGKTNKETGKAELLFNIPEDMKFFKEETTGKICVFGYTTYQSLKYRPLKNRVNVVLWDKATSIDCLPGVLTFNHFDSLLSFVKLMGKEYDVYICGGASLYNAFVPYCEKVELTYVDAIDSDADAFFPNLLEKGFEPEFFTPFHENDKTNGYKISFQVWTKKQG